MGKLFGTDGIRGVVGEYPMTPEVMLRVGGATASFFSKEHHQKTRGTPSLRAATKVARIVIGRDTRESGSMIEKTLVSGICSVGGETLIAGVMPTPGIAFITKILRADAGIVISASHNPFQDNGIKIFSGDGFKLPDEKEEGIEEAILSEEHVPESGHGKSQQIDKPRRKYSDFLKGTFPKEHNLKGTKIGLDCANGATYQLAPELFLESGADVKSFFVNPDGRNINDNCGSQHPERLAKEVVKNGIDVGLAFDGDGDRLLAVDEKGNVLTGDQVMVICAKVLKDEGKLSKNRVISTVMSNIGFGIALKELGIKHVKTKVGDRYVLEEMQKMGACLGGEDSGHIIFLDHHTTGDGILTALQLIAAMKKENKPLSELAKIMKVYPQVLINLTVKKKPEISSIPEIKEVIENVEKSLGKEGRVLVRYSGTQPMCRVMVEGPMQEETEYYCKKIAKVVEERLG